MAFHGLGVIVACHSSSVVFSFTAFMFLGLRCSIRNKMKKINVTITVGIDSLAVLYSSGKTMNNPFLTLIRELEIKGRPL